jgi:uncharacterized protein (DUF1778 family)
MSLTTKQNTPSVSRGRISARIPLNVQERVQQAADMIGATVNQFIIQSALNAADQIFQREKLLVLSNDETQHFFHLLDNPPAPNAALRSAQQRFLKRKTDERPN